MYHYLFLPLRIYVKFHLAIILSYWLNAPWWRSFMPCSSAHRCQSCISLKDIFICVVSILAVILVAVASRLGVRVEHCLMVGNDVTEDMEAAQEVGMNVFLLTDCLINKERRDISVYPRGSFEQVQWLIVRSEHPSICFAARNIFKNSNISFNTNMIFSSMLVSP